MGYLYSDARHKEQLEFYNSLAEPSLVENLGIEFTELSAERVVGTMPVDHRTRQPFGILHGGASVAFAETLASIGGWLNIDYKNSAIAGLEINANHLKPAREGILTGLAVPIRIGGSIQVWSVEIRNQSNEMISVSRCTLASIDRKQIPVLE